MPFGRGRSPDEPCRLSNLPVFEAFPGVANILQTVRKLVRVAQASRRYHLKDVMIEALEKRMIEALKSVEAHGDVGPAHVHDPMTTLLREKAIQVHLVRWDDARDRYVLTDMGRRRLSARSRAPGTVVSFRKRGAPKQR